MNFTSFIFTSQLAGVRSGNALDTISVDSYFESLSEEMCLGTSNHVADVSEEPPASYFMLTRF
jgi:hypothetical protein